MGRARPVAAILAPSIAKKETRRGGVYCLKSRLQHGNMTFEIPLQYNDIIIGAGSKSDFCGVCAQSPCCGEVRPNATRTPRRTRGRRCWPFCASISTRRTFQEPGCEPPFPLPYGRALVVLEHPPAPTRYALTQLMEGLIF